MSDNEKEIWLSLFRGELDFIRKALGSHAIEEFTYDIPMFLQACVKEYGPPDIDWAVVQTAPDCLVPVYLDNWWVEKDIQDRVGGARDWNDLETFGVALHADMLIKNYHTGSELPLPSATLEIERMKNLRASIARGGKTLEAELDRVYDRLHDLEDRLESSTKSIQVMEHEWRDGWCIAYADRLLAEDAVDDDSDEGHTDAKSLSVAPPMSAQTQTPRIPVAATSRQTHAVDITSTTSRPKKHAPPTIPPASTADRTSRPIVQILQRAESFDFKPLRHIKLSSLKPAQLQPQGRRELDGHHLSSSGAPGEFERILSEF
ncbi:uncharacterized protein LACBIDRAFT_327542 [Laccaria bicolor S238N-H82]|uniref:Predicted protein n=1 Tax=Laccaria bicolor (strain S238N-H82 / ATCC MYA-4686) TaxID=486041 RepID=B0DC26_LACBS|nr:uncharacterized protein LACBIDRAFT_327542 [Laccaria bicolor S238N-H82]EDR07819.1 predicted protein [Laccaria bicolor S238N-H82]|eukprot:XP_001881608.1 predicted protein [Laccaria bicolor S238N-H82]